MSDQAFRLVALKLHALHAQDKAWILGQLADEARERLSVLLKELRILGIQSLPEAVLSSGFPTSTVPLDAELVREIDCFDSELVFSLLDDLPLRQKALVFHAHPWRWTPALWNRFTDGERQRLVKTMGMMALTRPPVITSVLVLFRALGQKRHDSRISVVRG